MADFDFGGGIGDFGGGMDPISSYLPTSGPTMDPTAMSGPTGGGGSWLDTLSGYANTALPFLRLGQQGLGAFAGIEGMLQAGQQQRYMNQAQRTAQQAAQPALAAQQALLPAGTSALMGGQLPPGLQAQADQWRNDAKAKARAAYAHMGITDSTAMAQMDAYIDQLYMGLVAQQAQGLIAGGLGAGQGAISAAGLGGQLAGFEGQQANQAINQANQALFRLLGMGG